MPIITESTFRPLSGLGNGHLQTIWPTLFRKPPLVTKHRERLELADGDFLDLDWARHSASKKLVILTHGLESNSRDASIQGLATIFFKNGWNVLAWNMRGCSGEPNRLLRFYHSGATEDLAEILEHVSKPYHEIALVGLSLGGNITLKYIGENNDARITGGVAFSVPCDLTTSVDQLDSPSNRIYTRRFIKSLRRKIYEKKKSFPNLLDVSPLAGMRTFHEFDSAYTAPLHGFSSAEDYWAKASCLPSLANISIATLLVNATNDPFLSPVCFPYAAALENKYFHLETPSSGGHCGFVSSATDLAGWHGARALEFLENITAKRLPRD